MVIISPVLKIEKRVFFYFKIVGLSPNFVDCVMCVSRMRCIYSTVGLLSFFCLFSNEFDVKSRKYG